MKSFTEFNSLLVGRCAQRKKLANNTYAVRRELGAIAVLLHNADVVTYFPDGKIVLNDGGYRTSTTKDRMNCFSPVRISQCKGIWTFAYGSQEHTYANGCTLNPDGTVTGAATPSDTKANAVLRRKISVYAKRLAEKLPLALPGPGDCLYCHMAAAKTGKPLPNIDHLESHIRENYFVPSLVWSALLHAGCNPRGRGSFWFSKAFGPATNIGDNAQIARFVRKYLYRRFGLA
jgi:hypothetical protein